MNSWGLDFAQLAGGLLLSMGWGLFLGFLLPLMRYIFFSWLERKKA